MMVMVSAFRDAREQVKLRLRREGFMRCARGASNKQVARELWKIAQEYQAEAAKVDSDRVPDIGDPPARVRRLVPAATMTLALQP
jgi:hypothetical protein